MTRLSAPFVIGKPPTNDDAVTIPVANISPSLLNVIPLPTTTPFLAVISPTASIFVTSSYVKVPCDRDWETH